MQSDIAYTFFFHPTRTYEEHCRIYIEMHGHESGKITNTIVHAWLDMLNKMLISASSWFMAVGNKNCFGVHSKGYHSDTHNKFWACLGLHIKMNGGVNDILHFAMSQRPTAVSLSRRLVHAKAQICTSRNEQTTPTH